MYDVNLNDILDTETKNKIDTLPYDKSLMLTLKSPYKVS